MELKKYVDSQSAAADVIIEALFIFDEAGTFELPPVVVKVGKSTYKVEIPFINVSENKKLSGNLTLTTSAVQILLSLSLWCATFLL